jgi:hypothetical protein
VVLERKKQIAPKLAWILIRWIPPQNRHESGYHPIHPCPSGNGRVFCCVGAADETILDCALAFDPDSTILGGCQADAAWDSG